MDHVPIEREPDAPARRTKAETLRQIGDRLRQVNGDGPCNPPDLVLALDLLIDAHNETLRECETLRAAVAYRPGMPSSKQVRAHEARGGWWQFLYEGEEGPCMVKLRWEDHDGDASLIVGRHAGRIEFSRVSPPSSCRPVTFPDGTPCPWLAAPLDPAADNAQGGAPAKVSPRDIWRAPTLVNWCLLGGDSSEDPEEAARADAARDKAEADLDAAFAKTSAWLRAQLQAGRRDALDEAFDDHLGPVMLAHIRSGAMDTEPCANVRLALREVAGQCQAQLDQTAEES